MNRKTFRYLVPLVLLFGLIFTAVASADSSAPTVSTQVCIGFQGIRNNDEPISEWTVTQGTRSYTNTAGAVANADGTSVGTFDVTGEPGASYVLEIKGADTLKYTHNAQDPFPTAGAGPCAIDLSSVRLIDSDADGNGFIEASDINRWAARFRNPVECAGDPGYDNISEQADWNEDNCVDAVDSNFWSVNFGNSRTVQAAVNSDGTRGADEIRGDQLNYPSTINSFDIVADLTGAEYSTVQVEMSFDPSQVRVDSFTASGAFPTINSQSIDNTNGTFRVVVSQTGGGGNTGTGVGVVTVNVTVLDDSTPQTFEFIPFDAGPPTTGTFALDNNFNPAEGFASYQRVGIANATAVSMNELGTTQQSFVFVALIVCGLGIATLAVTRSARRQD